MDVSIIMINYNTLSVTRDSIDSIIKQTKDILYEIILVDNSSSDGSKEYFETRQDIKYIYSEDNLGFGRGNNLGLQHAIGRNILFLNSDTILKNNAIKILSDYLDNNLSVGVCGGNLFDCNNKPTISFERKRPSLLREMDSLFHGRINRLLYGKNTKFNYSGQPLRVGYISGADIMTRKSILQDVGGFNPIFFMYYEETELCNRIENKGFLIMSVPYAEIVHLEGKSINKGNSIFNEKKCNWMYDSFWVYLKLSKGSLHIYLIKMIHLLAFSKDSLSDLFHHRYELYTIEKIKRNIFISSYKKIICQ